MFLFFLQFYLNFVQEQNNNNEDNFENKIKLLINKSSKKRISFGNADTNITKNIHVIKIYPQVLLANFESILYVEFEPEFEEVCFCKFGSLIVNGIINEKGLGLCRVPAHGPGKDIFSFSLDLVNWDGNFTIFYKKPLKLSWKSIIFIFFLFTIIIGFTIAGCISRGFIGKKKKDIDYK